MSAVGNDDEQEAIDDDVHVEREMLIIMAQHSWRRIIKMTVQAAATIEPQHVHIADT